jgi:hypothetical protein
VKTYLGDGAYAEVKGGELILTTEDGVSVHNRIVLGGREWSALVAFVERETHSAPPSTEAP